jgi:hypothetical protein
MHRSASSRQETDRDDMNDRQKDLIQKFAALGSLAVLMLVFALTSDAFFSVDNGMTWRCR